MRALGLEEVGLEGVLSVLSTSFLLGTQRCVRKPKWTASAPAWRARALRKRNVKSKSSRGTEGTR